MSTKLGPSGSELTLAEPHVCRYNNKLIGSSDRMWDGTYTTDYTADKDVWHVEWEELTEAQLTAGSGVLTAADRSQALRWSPPDEEEGGDGWHTVHIGDHTISVDTVDVSPNRYNVVLEFEEQ